MNISNVPTPLVPDTRTTRADTSPAGAGRPGPAAVRSPVTRPTVEAPAARTNTAAPAVAGSITPPEGTDPKLWSILTSEERAYFAKSAAQGPVTYARVMLGTQDPSLAPSMRGLRLDIRG